MKINVAFEFAFSMDFKKHSMAIDLDDPQHAQLAEYIDADATGEELDEQIEDELGNYLQYDVIMPRVRVLNATAANGVPTYDLELELDGVKFTHHETAEDGKVYDPTTDGDLTRYIEGGFNETHHYFDVDVSNFTITK